MTAPVFLCRGGRDLHHLVQPQVGGPGEVGHDLHPGPFARPLREVLRQPAHEHLHQAARVVVRPGREHVVVDRLLDGPRFRDVPVDQRLEETLAAPEVELDRGRICGLRLSSGSRSDTPATPRSPYSVCATSEDVSRVLSHDSHDQDGMSRVKAYTASLK